MASHTFESMGSMRRPLEHRDTVAAKLRFSNFRILSAFNHKTPLGETLGYLTAILYLAPHTLAGGKTVCPHSTEACRAGCLYTAGRGAFAKVQTARVRRTRMFLDERDAFFDELIGELVQMQAAADAAGLKLAIRLNGTSDVAWERETLDGKTLFEMFDRATFYDYSRTPLRHRRVPPNWRLTWSLADAPVAEAVAYLRQGVNVAVVVPQHVKEAALRLQASGETRRFLTSGLDVHLVDGDAHDLRFLDPSPAIVMLKPKGQLRRGGPMVRHDFFHQMHKALA